MTGGALGDAAAMHPDQLTVSPETARELVAAQFPRWAGLPVRRVTAQGTVNALFRIGDGLVARFPLRPGDAGSVRRRLREEADAARELLGRTRFPTPEPVALGEPGAGYPLPWSVQTWIPGTVATRPARARQPGSPTTWPSSSRVCARSALGAGRSAVLAGAETCAATTRGWPPASPAARAWWMWPGRAVSGAGSGICPGSVPM